MVQLKIQAQSIGKLLITLGGLFIFTALLAGCIGERPGLLDDQVGYIIRENNLIAAEPAPEFTPELVSLGQALFFDRELSGNRDVSCATCHHPALGTGDALPLSIGVDGLGLGNTRKLGIENNFIARNAPEIFNRGDSHWFTMFWDNRVNISALYGGLETPAEDSMPEAINGVLAAQAMFPVTSNDEMRGEAGDKDVFGNNNEIAAFPGNDFDGIWQALMNRLLAIPEYESMFKAAYPGQPVNELGFEHAANAIAAFEIEAFTFTDSPWDRYLAGERYAMSDDAKRGAVLFYGQAGCNECHSGPLFTDQKPHNIGVPQLGPGKGESAPLDLGHFLESDDPVDRFGFRTPPLRNVTLTGPWMHNGAYDNLAEAVRHHLDPRVALLNYEEHNLPPEFQYTLLDDEATQYFVLTTLDPLLAEPIQLNANQFADLIAFLEALTSPSARDLSKIVPTSVPSGLPVDG
jgi:cytochrome c peroxidase